MGVSQTKTYRIDTPSVLPIVAPVFIVGAVREPPWSCVVGASAPTYPFKGLSLSRVFAILRLCSECHDRVVISAGGGASVPARARRRWW